MEYTRRSFLFLARDAALFAAASPLVQGLSEAAAAVTGSSGSTNRRSDAVRQSITYSLSNRLFEKILAVSAFTELPVEDAILLPHFESTMGQNNSSHNIAQIETPRFYFLAAKYGADHIDAIAEQEIKDREWAQRNSSKLPSKLRRAQKVQPLMAERFRAALPFLEIGDHDQVRFDYKGYANAVKPNDGLSLKHSVLSARSDHFTSLVLAAAWLMDRKGEMEKQRKPIHRVGNLFFRLFYVWPEVTDTIITSAPSASMAGITKTPEAIMKHGFAANVSVGTYLSGMGRRYDKARTTCTECLHAIGQPVECLTKFYRHHPAAPNQKLHA